MTTVSSIATELTDTLNLTYKQDVNLFTIQGNGKGLATGTIGGLTRADLRAVRKFINDVDALFPEV